MNINNIHWPAVLVLVRHAESEGNVRSTKERAEYEVASHQYALTPRGRAQAEITRAHLESAYGGFDAHYTSYYRRATETFGILYPTITPHIDPRLAEARRGIWHTMTRDEVPARFPEEVKRQEREGFYHYCPLGGENWPDIELRVLSFLDTLSRHHAGEKVVAVVHGHWLMLLQRLVQNLSIEEVTRRYYAGSVENASVTVFKEQSINGKSTLVLTSENITPWQGQL